MCRSKKYYVQLTNDVAKNDVKRVKIYGIWKTQKYSLFLNVCCEMVLYVFLCCSVCWFLYGPFCHGALKLDISTLFTTFFLWIYFQFLLGGEFHLPKRTVKSVSVSSCWNIIEIYQIVANYIIKLTTNVLIKYYPPNWHVHC